MDLECRRCHAHHPYDSFHSSKGQICRGCRTTYEIARRRELRHATTEASSSSEDYPEETLDPRYQKCEECEECEAAAESRQCRRCNAIHPLDRFLKQSNGNIGHICRRCRSDDAAVRQQLRYRDRHSTAVFEPIEPPSTTGDSPGKILDPRYQKCEECDAMEESSGEDPEEEDDPAPLGSLYVMENSRIPSELKVGRSRNPFKRARQLARSHNFEMKLVAIYPGVGHLETLVHSTLASDRVPGRSREFFKVSRKRVFSAISVAMGSFD